MNEDSATVILAERPDNSGISLQSFLELRGVEVLACADGIEAIRQSFAREPDVIILDVMTPRLNGYLCARVLRNDPSMRATPIVHVSTSDNSIERYWSTACGSDGFFQIPVDEAELDSLLNTFLRQSSGKRRLLSPVRMLPNLEDQAIFNLATSLLEQELLRANILNEINLMDISTMPTKEFITAIMAIIGSLYDFSMGIGLLLYEPYGEFFFYFSGKIGRAHLDEIKRMVFTHLEQRHSVFLDPSQLKQNLIPSTQSTQLTAQIDDLYIHTKESGPPRSLLAFENIGFETLREDEQEILRLALDLALGALEKKLFFQVSQELSIIDGVTEGYSLSFFMENLRREMENAARNRYPITIITLSVPDFENLTRDMSAKVVNELIRLIQNAIMKLLRKSDIVARWEVASFAFLLTHTPADKARVAQERIRKVILNDLTGKLPSAMELPMEMGIRQFDPEKDRTPEALFADAQPAGESEIIEAGIPEIIDDLDDTVIQ